MNSSIRFSGLFFIDYATYSFFNKKKLKLHKNSESKAIKALFFFYASAIYEETVQSAMTKRCFGLSFHSWNESDSGLTQHCGFVGYSQKYLERL